jgi:flagellar M-ring protein FliF
MTQKIILVGIVVAVLAGVAALVTVSSSPSLVPLFNGRPIRDDAERDRIMTRLDQENIKAYETPTGAIQVEDEKTRQKAIAILARENLVSLEINPWEIFNRERWTITDFERNVNLQNAITQTVTDHIKALEDVDNVYVQIVFPEDRLFASEQKPVSASVILIPRPGSNIAEDRFKIEGIQKLLKFAVEGLQDEYIVITDRDGKILNDFAGLAGWDRLTLIDRETKMIQKYEAQYRAKILNTLQTTYTEDRVRELDIKITMDMSQKSVGTTEFFPITMKPQTPGLAYDDSVLLESIPRSTATSKTYWEGTGFNPEGPAGVEGQVPPAYRDMSNLYGKVNQETATVNEEINQRVTQEEKSPEINRVTVSVNIDGTWKLKYDEKRNPIITDDGARERVYTPITPEDLRETQRLVQNAIGYNSARGDSVTVHNIQFDRTRQFGDEDAAYFRKKQIEAGVMIFLGGLAVLLIAFILFRTISREIERRRRLEAEERARREEALRQQALLQAEEEGMDVSISVEERTRMELQESVANMAKEHPEDAAQLIRTWLLEE